MTIFNGLFKQSWVRSKSNDNFHGVCVCDLNSTKTREMPLKLGDLAIFDKVGKESGSASHYL